MTTLLQLRTLSEQQLSLRSLTTSSNPSSTLVNSYINYAIRRIAKMDRPRELESATVTTADIVVSTNTVTIPATILLPDLVYYKYSGGSVKRLRYRRIKDMITKENPKQFFDVTNLGDPTMYTVRGSSILVNKYFSRSEVGAINIFGLDKPTVLSGDSDISDLPEDYDLLTVYEVAVYYYQKLDDIQNQQKFQFLAKQERDMLKITLDNNDEDMVILDPDTFVGNRLDASDPSVFFTS